MQHLESGKILIRLFFKLPSPKSRSHERHDCQHVFWSFHSKHRVFDNNTSLFVFNLIIAINESGLIIK